MLIDGQQIARSLHRRFNLVLRLPEAWGRIEGLRNPLIDTPLARKPVAANTIEEGDGPNQVSRRWAAAYSCRPTVYCASRWYDIRKVTGDYPRCPGLLHHAGRSSMQEDASRSVCCRWCRWVFDPVIPLLLGRAGRHGQHLRWRRRRGGGLWLSGQLLSRRRWWASSRWRGLRFATDLKVSHYVNLCAFEGENFTPAMLLREARLMADAGADDRHRCFALVSASI
jgi:HME family heavy-metal exporter